MTDSILEFIKTFFMLFFELLALFIVSEFYCEFNSTSSIRGKN